MQGTGRGRHHFFPGSTIVSQGGEKQNDEFRLPRWGQQRQHFHDESPQAAFTRTFEHSLAELNEASQGVFTASREKGHIGFVVEDVQLVGHTSQRAGPRSVPVSLHCGIELMGVPGTSARTVPWY